MSGSNILVIVTGSIAGYKACDAISQLVQRGHRVRTVLTKSARNFVGEATLEGLTGERVLTDLFAPGDALEHIELTRWADVMLICPATAGALNRFAVGLADDLAGAVFLAHDRSKPCLIAPAMNPAMWSHPATVAAVAKLTGWGARFIAVGEGRTACGELGAGRLAEPAEIVAAIEAARLRPPRPLRVLITSGATAEPIDGVRVLTNLSTGHTGAGLADHFARCGHDVVLLRARSAVAAAAQCREEIFVSFAELDAALNRWLATEEFDAVVHAAAVGDFGVEAVVIDGRPMPVGTAKLDSGARIELRLHPQPKLIESLRARSRNPALDVVAFKLTAGADGATVRAAVADIFGRADVDLVVHNDLADRKGEDDFPADIYRPGEMAVVHCASRGDLAASLERLLAAVPATTAR